MNRLELSAVITEIESLRYTPAGLPLIRLMLEHNSEALEAGFLRKLNMHIKSVAIGDVAAQVARKRPGASIHVAGFLAPIKKGSDFLVLHIQELIGTE